MDYKPDNGFSGLNEVPDHSLCLTLFLKPHFWPSSKEMWIKWHAGKKKKETEKKMLKVSFLLLLL